MKNNSSKLDSSVKESNISSKNVNSEITNIDINDKKNKVNLKKVNKKNGKNIKIPPKIKMIDKDIFLFTLDLYDSFIKPIKNCVLFFKYWFTVINIFNVIYLSINLFQVFSISFNPDIDFILSGVIGLTILAILFGIRIFKSLYGIFSALCATNRRPLYLFLILNYITSSIYIFFGIFILFSNYISSKFDQSLVSHLINLEKHENEDPRWYWVEHTQFYGNCCGYQSFADYITTYAVQMKVKNLEATDLFLPNTCCTKTSNVNESCTIYNKGLNKIGCAGELIKEELENIIAPISFLLILDVLLLFISIYLMNKFKERGYRLEIKENETDFLNREEERLINELLNLNIIKKNEIDSIRTKFRFVVRVEKAALRRDTLEGLTIVIHKNKNDIDLKIVNASSFNKIDDKKIFLDKISLDKNLKNTKTKQIKDIEELLKTKVNIVNVLKMTGGEDLTNITSATEDNLPESLKKKIKSYIAVRTRDTIFEINKRLDAIKTLENANEKPTLFRINSINLRCDKATIENDVKQLKQKAEALPQNYKTMVTSSDLLSEKDDENVYKIKKLVKLKGLSKLLKFGKNRKVKNKNEFFENNISESNSDEVWHDIR